VVRNVLNYPTWGQTPPAPSPLLQTLLISNGSLYFVQPCFSFRSLSITTCLNLNDVQAAMTDIMSQNFFGLTFLLPIDQELTRHSMSPDHLEDFMLSHSIPMPLKFSGLNHFPSGLEHQLIEIKNRGKADFSVNNAQVIKPNLCVNYTIKCHGIDSVIKFENDWH